MARFQLNSTRQILAPSSQPEHVRIGAISLFALVVVICLAVLAVLAFSTANASWTMTQRQAVATTELYLDEAAAQEFVAGVDALLAAARTAEGADADEGAIELGRNKWGNVAYDENGLVVVIDEEEEKASRAGDEARRRASAAMAAALPDLCAAAQQAANGQVTATAEAFDNRIRAEFSCQNGRLLTVVLTVRANGTYRIDRWKMSAVQNEEEPEGQFWISD